MRPEGPRIDSWKGCICALVRLTLRLNSCPTLNSFQRCPKSDRSVANFNQLVCGYFVQYDQRFLNEMVVFEKLLKLGIIRQHNTVFHEL